MTAALLVAAVVAVVVVLPDAPVAAAGPAFPDAGATAVIARYQERIPQLMAEQGVPGLALAVVDGDRVLWTEGFGTTERDGGTPVTTDTIFGVQSMSKTFTATAVMQAVGAGRLDLDEPITTYLPGFTVHSAFEEHPERRITLRMLLAHTAGFTHEAPYGNNIDLGEADFERHVASIADTWLRFPVGTGYAYSNLGIDLAGAILARAWGEPFAEAVEDSLLGPLGMDHSTFDQARIRATADRAVGHVGLIPRPQLEVPMAAAGGLYSSAADLATFLRFQLGDGVIDGRTVLDRARVAEMRTIPAPHEGARAGYALGVARVPWRAQRYVDLFTHGGGGFGFLADLWWVPSVGLGIAVLTNSADHELQVDLAISILRDLVTEPGSVYRDRLAAQPMGRDAIEPRRFEPPADYGRLVAGAAMPPIGDEAARWAAYEGRYRMRNWGVLSPLGEPGAFLLVNGVPNVEVEDEAGRVRHRLVEVERGLFLADNGEMLDFRGSRPTWAGIDLVPVSGGPSAVGWVVAGLAILAAVLWLAGGSVAWVLRRRRRGDGAGTRPGASGAPRWWRNAAAVAGSAVAVACLATVALVVALPGVVDSGFLGWLRFPFLVRLVMHAPMVVGAGAAVLVGLVVTARVRGWWRARERPGLALLTVAATLLAVQVTAWGLVGWGLG